MGKPVGGALKYVSGIDFIGFIYVAAERRSLHDAFAKICMVLVLWKVKPMWFRRIGMVFVQFWWGKGIASQYHLQRGQKAIPEWVWAKLQISQTSAHRSCIHWSYGVTVSTLDSESSDRGSNPRRTLSKFARARLKTEKSSVRASPLVLFWIGAVNGNAMLCSTLFGINMLSWRVPWTSSWAIALLFVSFSDE